MSNIEGPNIGPISTPGGSPPITPSTQPTKPTTSQISLEGPGLKLEQQQITEKNENESTLERLGSDLSEKSATVTDLNEQLEDPDIEYSPGDFGDEGDLLESLERITGEVEEFANLLQEIADTKAEIKRLKKEKPENYKEDILKLQQNLIQTTNQKSALMKRITEKIKVGPSSPGEVESTEPETSGLMDLFSAGEGTITEFSTLIAKASALKQNYKRMKVLREEKMVVQQQIENEPNDTVKMALELRLKNLDYQMEENSVSAVRNMVVFTGQAIGTAASIQTLSIETAISAGATFGGLTSATGVGAVAVGGVSLVIGAGYLLYKNRHSIENTLQNAGISAHQFLISMSKGFDEEKFSKLQEVINESGAELAEASAKTLEDIQEEDEEIRKAIEELESQGNVPDLEWKKNN